MEQIILERNGKKVVEISAPGVVVSRVQDALDLMAGCRAQGAECIILHAHHLHPDFFDLRTGLAGEILQKFSNYQMKVAVLGDFRHYASESLQAFIRESNRGRQVFFVQDTENALQYLTR